MGKLKYFKYRILIMEKNMTNHLALLKCKHPFIREGDMYVFEDDKLGTVYVNKRYIIKFYEISP